MPISPEDSRQYKITELRLSTLLWGTESHKVLHVEVLDEDCPDGLYQLRVCTREGDGVWCVCEAAPLTDEVTGERVVEDGDGDDGGADPPAVALLVGEVGHD